MKQTKASKFRELLPTIETLLESYTYKGVIEALEEKHNFIISEDTFGLYLHRERAKVKKGENVESNNVQNPKTVSSNASLKEVDNSSLKKETVVNQKEDVKENNVSSAPSEKVKRKKATPEELKVALAKMKNEMNEEEYNWENLL